MCRYVKKFEFHHLINDFPRFPSLQCGYIREASFLPFPNFVTAKSYVIPNQQKEGG